MLTERETAEEPGTSPDDALVADILQKRKQSDTHLAAWRANARVWYGMVSGEQWKDADKALLDEQSKPCVSFNRAAVVVNALCGSEANNRQEVNFLPRRAQPPVPGKADLLTAAAKWARDQCDAEDEESDAFRDTIICGYGWTETKMDYERNPEGMVLINRRDPGAFRYDPKAIRRNIADATWIQCDDYLDDDCILARWPDADLSGPSIQPDDSDKPHDAQRAPFYQSSQSRDVDDEGRLVIHHVWTESVTVWNVLDPTTNQTVELSDEKYQAALIANTQAGMPFMGKRRSKLVYKHAYILGRTILEQGMAPCQYEFVYKCITGYRNRNDATFYGLVKQIEDPQRYANKMLSQLLHIINTNAKGGLLVEEGATDDIRDLEEKWAKTDGVIVVKPGALSQGKIQPKPLPMYPQAISDLLQFSVSSIRDGSGVNLEMLGLADRMQAGVVEKSRTEAGMTSVATLFDSLRQYRKQQGRLLAHFLIEYMADGRLIRIAGPLGQSYAPFLKEAGVMEYDIIVDDAPTSRDMKEKTFRALMEITPMVLQNGGPVPSEALDYAPIPADLADSWKRQIEEKKQQGPQPTEPVQIAQIQAQSHEKVEKMKLDAHVQTEQAKAQATANKSYVDGQIKMALAQQDSQTQKEIAAMKANFDAQMEAMKAYVSMNNSAAEQRMNGARQ